MKMLFACLASLGLAAVGVAQSGPAVIPVATLEGRQRYPSPRLATVPVQSMAVTARLLREREHLLQLQPRLSSALLNQW